MKQWYKIRSVDVVKCGNRYGIASFGTDIRAIHVVLCLEPSYDESLITMRILSSSTEHSATVRDGYVNVFHHPLNVTVDFLGPVESCKEVKSPIKMKGEKLIRDTLIKLGFESYAVDSLIREYKKQCLK